jgi:hypothetical protein
MIVKDGPVTITDDEGWGGPCPTCGSIYASPLLLRKVVEAASEVGRVLSSWDHPYPATEDDELEAAHEKLLRAYDENK